MSEFSSGTPMIWLWLREAEGVFFDKKSVIPSSRLVALRSRADFTLPMQLIVQDGIEKRKELMFDSAGYMTLEGTDSASSIIGLSLKKPLEDLAAKVANFWNWYEVQQLTPYQLLDRNGPFYHLGGCSQRRSPSPSASTSCSCRRNTGSNRPTLGCCVEKGGRNEKVRPSSLIPLDEPEVLLAEVELLAIIPYVIHSETYYTYSPTSTYRIPN